MYECLAWIILLLLTQWLFGNLYEALAIVPNALSLIRLRSQEGKALFQTKRASPVAYYIPSSSFGLVLILILTIDGLFHRKPGTLYLLIACGLVLAGAGLAFYMVRYITIDLFLKPQMDFARAQKLLRTWTNLNYIRLTIAAVSVLFVILWIRTVIKP